MKDYILKNGLVFGAISIILNSAAYSLGVDFFMSPALSFFKIIFYVTVLVFLTLNFRKIIGDYISFKETFSVSLRIVAAGSFISTMFIMLLFNFRNILSYSNMCYSCVIYKKRQTNRNFRII